MPETSYFRRHLSIAPRLPASRRRARPSTVRAPVLSPPCILHRVARPLRSGRIHTRASHGARSRERHRAPHRGRSRLEVVLSGSRPRGRERESRASPQRSSPAPRLSTALKSSGDRRERASFKAAGRQNCRDQSSGRMSPDHRVRPRPSRRIPSRRAPRKTFLCSRECFRRELNVSHGRGCSIANILRFAS